MKNTFFGKILHSVSSRITFVSSIFVVLALLAGTGVCVAIFTNMLRDRVKAQTNSELRVLDKELNVMMIKNQTLGKTLARMVADDIVNGRATLQELQQKVDNIASTTNSLSACAICLDGSMVSPKLNAPFVFHDGLVEADGIEMNCAPSRTRWYKEARRLRIGIWSDPALSSSPNSPIISSYVYPINDNLNRKLGEVVFLISRENFQEVISYERPSLHAFNQLIDGEGLILAASDTNRTRAVSLLEQLQQEGVSHPEQMADEILGESQGLIRVSLGLQKGYCCYKRVARTNWTLLTFIPMDDIYEDNTMLKFIFVGIGLAVLAFIAVLCIRAWVHSNLRPLRRLTTATADVAKGNFQFRLPTLDTYGDEISGLAASFETMRQSLQSHIDKERDDARERERIDKEIQIAHNIQLDMLPESTAEHPYLDSHDFYATMQAAREVGGDLYHYHYIPNNFLFSVGDISGKGVPSAIFMAQIIMQLRNISITPEKEHSRNLSLINRSACAENPLFMFTTLILAQLNLATGELITCSAGHDAPLMVGPDGRVEVLPVESNIPIGLDPSFNFVKQSHHVAPGSMLFFYSDGVTEASNSQDELYGIDRLCYVLRGANTLTPKEVVERVQKDIAYFVGDAEQSDDITMFAVKYKSPVEES